MPLTLELDYGYRMQRACLEKLEGFSAVEKVVANKGAIQTEVKILVRFFI